MDQNGQGKPTPWQQDAQNVKDNKSDRVAFWRNGVMLTATMTCEQARRLVREGRAYVINAGAIGALDEHGNRAG